MAKFSYHDTETTGGSSEDRIIETAHILVENGEFKEHIEDLCKATVKIKPAAAMIHGYRNRDVKNKPEFNKTKSAEQLLSFSQDKDLYYVAHNAPFDLGMLEKEGISFPAERVIDTLRVARHMYQSDERIEMYKLQYFRYVFETKDGGDEFEDLEDEYMKKLNITHIQPHTALSDILILWIFHNKLEKDFKLSAKDMVELSQKPVLENGIQFGNVFEKGKPYKEIMEESYFQYGKSKRGYEYLMWAVENMKMSVDREYTIKFYLANGLINNQISSISQNIRFINWGIIFSFDKDETEKALKLIEKDIEYVNILKTGFKKQTESVISKIEELGDEATAEDVEELNKHKFMLRYFLNYRN